MDIQIGNRQAGKIIMELRNDVVPRTAGKYFLDCKLSKYYSKISVLI